MAETLGIAVLGATGSVGRQALDVIQAFPDRFRVVALAANRSAGKMAELVAAHRPVRVAMADSRGAAELRRLLSGRFEGEVEEGEAGLTGLATCEEADVVLASIVGRGGLPSVLAAVQAGKRVALANKEALVMAGELVMREAERHRATVVPVDSEHAAIRQLLDGVGSARVGRIVLTASGGPFLGATPRELEEVTADKALAHPNWSMGAKISIDSATMMNKGFEVMEARWLFDLPPERIEVLVHPESLVHALVETRDGSWLASMAQPDMRIPIAQALARPGRLDLPARLPGFTRLDLVRAGSLTFQVPDPEVFPALGLCRQALQMGGGVPAALSVADEIVVEAFLRKRIPFTAISAILARVLGDLGPLPAGSLEEVQAAGELGARLAHRHLGAWTPPGEKRRLATS